MEIAVILLLILLNGIFAMSEIALISARKSRLEADAREGNRSARTALNLARKPDKFLSTIQIGITLIGILTGIYSGDVLAQDLGSLLARAGIPAAWSVTAAKTVIVIAVTYLTLIFGELVPKRIGMSASEKAAKAVARPMNLLSAVASPFVWLLSKSTSFFFNILGMKEQEEKVTEEEIKAIIQEGTADGEIQEVEQDIVERVFGLGDRKVESIMTHRSEMVTLDADATPQQITDTVRLHPFDLYPVTEGGPGNIIGIVRLKDLFGEVERPGFRLRSLLRPAHYFHENLSVYNALEQMKNGRIKYGLVSDEFGDIQGIVTLKDILEGLIGSMPEKDEEQEIVQREDGSFLVDGQCSFYDFLAFFDLEELFPKYDYNTLSGLILEELEHIPRTGERLRWREFDLEIVDMDGARIDKVLVTHRQQPDM